MVDACCRLRQVIHKLWHEAFPLLHGMGVWTVTIVGEPPSDVNAQVLVRTGVPHDKHTFHFKHFTLTLDAI